MGTLLWISCRYAWPGRQISQIASPRRTSSPEEGAVEGRTLWTLQPECPLQSAGSDPSHNPGSKTHDSPSPAPLPVDSNRGDNTLAMSSQWSYPKHSEGKGGQQKRQDYKKVFEQSKDACLTETPVTLYGDGPHICDQKPKSCQFEPLCCQFNVSLSKTLHPPCFHCLHSVLVYLDVKQDINASVFPFCLLLNYLCFFLHQFVCEQ